MPYTDDIQALYLGLLGRAADPGGLSYWQHQLESGALSLEQLRANLVNEQPEYQQGLGALLREQVVTRLYQQLFDREPEAEGLDYWVNGAGQAINIDQLVLALVDGAGSKDSQALSHRTEVANAVTQAIASNDVDFDMQRGISLLANVGANPESRDAALEHLFVLRTSEKAGDGAGDGAGDESPAPISDALQASVSVSLADDPLFHGRESLVIDAVEQAMNNWLDLMALAQPVDITLAVGTISNSNALASGGSSFYSNDALPSGGVPSVLANKLMTGEDSNGVGADAFINFSEQNFDLVGFDSVTSSMYSADKLITHEIGHGLGILSFQNDADTLKTVWDTFLVQGDNNDWFFTGEHAVQAWGGQLPLDALAHLSEETFGDALMTPQLESGSDGAEFTAVELGILRDIGLPLA